MKTLWIDLLCFNSIIKVFYGARRDVDIIKYIHVHKHFKPFINLFSKLSKKPIVQVTNIIYSKDRIDDENLIEIIENRTHENLNFWVDSNYVEFKITKFIKQSNFNKNKYRQHLINAAYYYALRPIEIITISEFYGDVNNDYFLFKHGPLNNLWKNLINSKNVSTYYYFGNYKSINPRKNYYRDSLNNSNYYANNLSVGFKIQLKWFIDFFLSILLKPIKVEKGESPNICVELFHSKFDVNNMNDLYWLKESSINPKSVIGFTAIDYDDKSLKNINDLGVKVINIFSSNYKLILKKISQKGKHINFIFVEKKFYIFAMLKLLKLLPHMFFPNQKNWLKLQEGLYFIKSRYWELIYKKMNIRILWSMSDMDDEKLIKAQAIELSNGFFLGSHWSNFPTFQESINQCYDIFFCWNSHFSSNIFKHYKYQATFNVGYPADYYFDVLSDKSDKLRRKFPGKFIISFFDNITANDMHNSQSIKVEIYSMLIGLLECNNNLTIFLKPKKEYLFYEDIKLNSDIQKFINNGQIVVLFGGGEGRKACPAEIGMASDLVIGLGISSAASESCFSGTVSFHVDVSRFNNSFANFAQDKVVFSSIKKLRNAVDKQIIGEGISITECKKYHHFLDSYQDGKAFKRTGDVIGQLQNIMKDDMTNNEVIQIIKIYNY